MLPITENIIPVNQFSRDGKKLVAKKGIVMHYTGDPGASAADVARYFRNLKDQNPNDSIADRYAGAHFTVDRCTKIRNIPTDERAYHCGSTTYTPEALKALGAYPNNTTVGIEMCIEPDGSIHPDTFKNAAEVAAYLIKEEGWPEAIWTHKGVVGWKDCPLPWVQNPAEYTRFKSVVHDLLYPPLMAQWLIDVVVGTWMEPQRATYAKQMGYIQWLIDQLRGAASGPLDKDVANTIINTWIVPAWDEAKNANVQTDMDNCHTLANAIRAAAGIPQS